MERESERARLDSTATRHVELPFNGKALSLPRSRTCNRTSFSLVFGFRLELNAIKLHLELMSFILYVVIIAPADFGRTLLLVRVSLYELKIAVHK